MLTPSGRRTALFVEVLALNVVLVLAVKVVVGSYDNNTKIVVAITGGVFFFGRLWRSAHALVYGAEKRSAPVPIHTITVYNRALAILNPIRDMYYRPGSRLAAAELPAEASAALRIAVNCFDEARKLEQTRGDAARQNAAVALKEKGVTLRLLGELTDARACLAAAADEIEALPVGRPPDLELAGNLQSLRGWCALELGDTEALRGNAATALQLADKADELFKVVDGNAGRNQVALLRAELAGTQKLK